MANSGRRRDTNLKQRAWSKFGLWLLLTALLPWSAAAATLDRIELSQASGTTTVTLHSSSETKYHYFGLSNPDRLVLDLSSITSNLKGASAHGGVVKKIRSGKRNNNDLRIVFDLTGAVTVDVKRAGNKIVARLQAVGKHGTVPVSQATPKPAAKPRGSSSAAGPAALDPDVVKQEIKRRRPIRVVIDAGHGGKDTGAIGPGGTREKDVALAVAKRLYNILNESPDFAPIMSRDNDRFLKLRQRTNVARTHKADAFVSVHANSFTKSSVKGGAVYALSIGGASSEHARWLAERENAADLVGGVSIQDKDNSLASVLLDLSQTATLEASLELASDVINEMAKVAPMHKKSVQQAGFLVLKSPDIPSILVETAFISNPKEERKLRDARFQQKLASALFKGIRNFFVTNPPPGTLFASHGGRYIVRPGDTLGVLAQRWGTSVAAISKANNIRGSNIAVGQQLVIP